MTLIYLSQTGKDITEQVELVIAEIISLAKRNRIELRSCGRSVAIFCAETFDNAVHVGWHYAGSDDIIGATFHYDHGAGIDRNSDGKYIWISPETNELLLNATAVA